MFHPFIKLLLVVTYAVASLAAAPHAHAVDSSGRSAQPHIHIKGAAACTHNHPHQHGIAHNPSRPIACDCQPLDHDDGCVYLPHSLSASPSAKTQTLDSPTVSTGPSHCVLLPGSVDATLPSAGPPDALPSGRDLCLILRALRI
jgi:hypothetical protein